MKRYRLTPATPRPDSVGNVYAASLPPDAMWTVPALSFFMIKDFESNGDRATWHPFREICTDLVRASGWISEALLQQQLEKLVELRILEVDFLN